MFGHHVRPYGEIGRTISKFGRTMSDDRLLFPALCVDQRSTEPNMLEGEEAFEGSINRGSKFSRRTGI